MNLFFVGSSKDEAVVGRAFLKEDEVEIRQGNLLVAETKRDKSPRHQSFVETDGVDIFAMVERYYRDSEQKMGRFFHHENEVALLKAMPGGDEGWIRRASTEEVFAIPSAEEAQLLEERTFRFRCGCDKEKIAGTLLAVYGAQIDEIFGGDQHVEVDCPRCGSRVTISREGYARRLNGDDEE